MKAEIIIYRKWFSTRKTIGELYINGVFFCYTLEDTMRPKGVKVPEETGIPEGEYKCKISNSERFGRNLPLIYTEPDEYELIKDNVSFKGVRIHGGATKENNEGCILVAYNKLNNTTIQGTAEYDLTKKLKSYKEITVVTLNTQIK